MLVAGFRDAGTAAVYGVGMVALGLHLFHGVASSVQTFGLNGPRSFPWLERAGAALALLSPRPSSPSPAGILAGLAEGWSGGISASGRGVERQDPGA